MIKISYFAMVAFITVLWILVRFLVCRKQVFSLKRELELILVYICLIVVARFTFFPFSKVNGKIQPLIFDPSQLFPIRLNLIPIAYLFDYEIRREALINVIGNTTMFMPSASSGHWYSVTWTPTKKRSPQAWDCPCLLRSFSCPSSTG